MSKLLWAFLGALAPLPVLASVVLSATNSEGAFVDASTAYREVSLASGAVLDVDITLDINFGAFLGNLCGGSEAQVSLVHGGMSASLALQLSTSPDGVRSGFVTTTFDDDAAAGLPTAACGSRKYIGSGIFRTDFDTLGIFDGMDAGGVWTVVLQDFDNSAPYASLSSFTLNVTVAEPLLGVPEPATPALASIALLGVAAFSRRARKRALSGAG